MLDRQELVTAVRTHGTVARVVIIETRGSVPREAGTEMLVWEDGQSGTIGGGRLEFDVAQDARARLTAGGDLARLYPLGPALGQCCGGAVRVLTEIFDLARAKQLPEAGIWARPLPGVDTPQPAHTTGLSRGWFAEEIGKATRSLWVWGAGHVGRAIVQTMAPLPDFDITWVDTDLTRFPAELPTGVSQLCAQAPDRLVPHAPRDADHIIVTYSHELDLALCHGLLIHGFHHCGLIGSETKWARFTKRLRSLGQSQAEISRISCPIGDPSLGKHPQAIAVGVAAALIKASSEQENSRDGSQWAHHSYHSRG